MKKLMNRFLRKMREPKWRNGRWSVLILSAFIALCVLLNIAVATLEKEHGWRKDYSFNGYATTGEETQAALERLTETVDIYLLYQSGQMDSQLMALFDRYVTLNDLIQVRPTDIAQNPGVFNRFKGDFDTALEENAVIVNCEATGRYRVLTYYDFVAQGYNVDEGTFEVAGLAYEKRLTEAIIYVAEKNVPMVGVLQGHGELTTEELKHFLDFLQSNHYDSKPVNLLGGESLETIDLLLIAAPQKDLSAQEIQVIDAFARDGGSLFITRDYTDPMALPNYFALLKNYGVQPLPGVVIAGQADEGSFYGERIYLLPYMCEMDMTLPLIAGKLDILLLAGASAFETPSEPSAMLTVGTVLKSGPTAYLRDALDGQTSIEQQPGDRTGEMSLALYAQRMHATGNVSRMFAIGNSPMLTDEYIYQSTFTGEFLIQVMNELLPQKTISLDIMASAAFHPGLRAGSHTVGIVLIAAVPAAILIAAFFVLVPRRNR